MEEDVFVRVQQELLSCFTVVNHLSGPTKRKKKGSVSGRKNIEREFTTSHDRIFNDYFAENAKYNASLFERRFRMSRDLFMKIMDAVQGHSSFFQQKRNATGKWGASCLQKCVAAIRILAYGNAADAYDEYCGISETLAFDSLKHFCAAVIEIYGNTYLRTPNSEDVQRLMKENEQRGFPGMLGSLDCMHWEWKNCPKAWKGQYQGKSNHSSIILEAIASFDLWIWHCFFGTPGSNNDINVLNRSPLIPLLVSGSFPECPYEIEGKTRTQGYFLADGIYPPWSIFVQTITEPQGEKKAYFARKQEALRKDVERAFGVLQSRFHILARPSRFWYSDKMNSIVSTCVIIHNMIVEQRAYQQPTFSSSNIITEDEPISRPVGFTHNRSMTVLRGTIAEVLQRTKALQDGKEHLLLRSQLVDHLWKWRGSNE